MTLSFLGIARSVITQSEPMKNKLITEKQMRMVHALLSEITQNEAELTRYKEKVKSHYKIPSTWQLTRTQAKKLIDRLLEISEKQKLDQTALVNSMDS